jgi:DNA-binding NtrC family response regulator
MGQKPRVLIVDDEPDVVANLREVLDQDGYPCVTAMDGAHGLKLLESERPDIVLTDHWMPRIDGMAILSRAVELDPDAVVIMITGHGTVQSAVEAMRAGAFEYLLKPLPSNDTLRLVVRRGADRGRLVEENRRLREPLASRVGFELVGKSTAMVAVLDLVQKAARSESNILIQGESGTGKELIARAIHANSPRASEVFVPLDCAALLAVALLEAYPWPGNVRELQNVIERACALADGPTLRPRDLPEHVRGRGRPAPTAARGDLTFRDARESWLRAFAPEYLTDLLRRHGGNVSQAAKAAGLERKTLHGLLAKYGING